MAEWDPETDAAVREKLAQLERLFADAFGADGAVPGPFVLASAPGRVEVAGNHVDHQGGRTISAAIGERTWGLAAENGLARIRVAMEGFGAAEIDLAAPDWAEPRPAEALASAALVRGMAAAFAREGGTLRGFDLVTVSDVPSGGGLSSSAAFEVMAGAALQGLFGAGSADAGGTAEVPLDPVAIALAATEAERRYFGKPCGAQDQMACACGGVIAIDFAPEVPVATPVPLHLADAGYAAVLVDSRQDHSLHQDEFAAIPADMFRAARALGSRRLGDVPVQALLDALPALRDEAGDRCAMRALHYYDEVRRVDAQRAALEAGDFQAFLAQVRLSGMSSAQFLQNVSVRGAGQELCQPAMVIQSLCAHLLGERGAWRIHGGGFGGAVLVFVPADEAPAFAAAMDGFLGYAACRPVAVGGAGVRARCLS